MTSDPSSSSLSLDIEHALARWGGIVRRAAHRYGFDGPDLQEIEQDIRIRLWRALERQGENPKGVGASYVQEAAKSATIDLLRRRRREREQVALDQAGDVPASSRAGGDEEQLTALLERAITALAPDRRVAVRLHLEGRDRDDIVRLTGWSEARTRNLLYRGLEDLRSALRGEGAA
ncbi:MAG TPA: sigma-70 family RNA polymerase sigma factor [Gemmatimonadales bacterium]|nr:sigma-70 family RNA polymerase sigma factor [Gemmatimonadales bacterium]